MFIIVNSFMRCFPLVSLSHPRIHLFCCVAFRKNISHEKAFVVISKKTHKTDRFWQNGTSGSRSILSGRTKKKVHSSYRNIKLYGSDTMTHMRHISLPYNEQHLWTQKNRLCLDDTRDIGRSHELSGAILMSPEYPSHESLLSIKF